jgi:hypothetical protein
VIVAIVIVALILGFFWYSKFYKTGRKLLGNRIGSESSLMNSASIAKAFENELPAILKA